MNTEQAGIELADLIADMIDARLQSMRYFADYGVVSAVRGALVDVKINGSNDVTKDVPKRSDLMLVVGDKVTILRLNYNANERLIIDKIA